MKARTFRIICISFVALIMAIVIALDVTCYIFADTLTLYLGSTALSDDLRTEGEKLALRIEEEGAVLVKNDGCLPLNEEDNKVNVLGWSSTQWIMGGSGSGRTVQYGSITGGSLTPETDLLAALKDYGVQYNEQLINMYVRYQPSRPYWTEGSLSSHDYEFCRLYEPSINDPAFYSSSVVNSALQFSDTAIVVLGRVSGESLDCPRVQYKGKIDQRDPAAVSDETRTYLDISAEEEELLFWAGQNFEKVVVIVNAMNAMNLGFLDEIEGLDACLLVGGTGNNAANAIPEILYGKISPSGRTADTYAYQFSTAASFIHAGADGVKQYRNAEEADLYPNNVSNVNVGDNREKYPGVSYLDYAEGIYVGYKWYETADAEGFWDSDFAEERFGVRGYDKIVQYPFGYGLSYSDFSWEVVSVSPAAGSTLQKEDNISITVRVTNTGDHTARDVVELYYCVPYTKYGVEKSAISLGAFAKTDELEAGQSQELTLSFAVSDMASYDMGIKVQGGGYLLEQGEYRIRLMTDAHTPKKNCTGGDVVYSVKNDVRYTTDPVTGNKVGNLFTAEGSDGIAIDGSDSGGQIAYMSRANFEESFPLAISEAREMSEPLKQTNLFGAEDAAEAWKEDLPMPDTGKKNGILLYDGDGNATEAGLWYGNPANYNDDAWNDLLDQLALKEMYNLILHGYRQETSIPSVGKPTTLSAYGPAQIGSFNSNDSGVGYPTPTVLAQSWNSDLAYEYGLTVGKEAGDMKYSGWYAPGANLHRSPFGGRNFENYAEDSYLTGMICTKTVQGALDAGIYTYVKHFAAYGQETYRDGLYCWMSEQTLRELYLSPFKRAIDGGATGVMTAFTRIGGVWTGGSRGLLTDLLRNEWNFKGTVITEYADHHEYINADQMLIAGGDLWMCSWNNDGWFRYFDKSYEENAAFVTALRTASKRVIYTGLNAAYRNSIYNENAPTPIVKPGISSFIWWIWLLVAINAVALCSCGIWIYYAVRRKDLSADNDSRPAQKSGEH